MIKAPSLPKFEKLSLDHLPVVQSAMSAHPAYSEFSFTNLFAWNTTGLTEISSSGEELIALLRNRETGNSFFTVIGSGPLDALLEALLDESQTRNLEGLRLVPQVVVENLRHRDRFAIEEDRNNFDYVLSAQYHAQLEGSRNATRRRFIRRFLREQGDALAVAQLDLTDPKVSTEISDCMSRWINIRCHEPQDAEPERLALARVLNSSPRLSVHGLGIYLRGTLRAFVLYEYLNRDMAIVHFEKCDLAFKGIAPYVRNTLAKLLVSNGIRYINYEQDLGLEGLRRAKSQLHPDDFLKKYTVRKAASN